jgi:hypothetical protein
LVFLRATRQVFRHLPPVSTSDAEADTALGDWYVKRTVVDRAPHRVRAPDAEAVAWTVGG